MPEGAPAQTPQPITILTHPKVIQVTHQVLSHPDFGPVIQLCDVHTGEEIAASFRDYPTTPTLYRLAASDKRIRELEAEVTRLKGGNE